MELSAASSTLSNRPFFFQTKPSLSLSTSSRLLLKTPPPLTRIIPGSGFLSTTLLRSKNYEESSISTDEQIDAFDWKSPKQETETDVHNNAPYEEISNEESKEEAPLGGLLAFDFLDKLDFKVNSEDTYSVLIYGSSALITLWLASAVVGAIDSIPVFPKVLEIVGLAYTIWFTSRYLILKKNRAELLTKIEEIKQQILGSD